MLSDRVDMPGDALRWGVLACIALVLATPFVFTPGTIYPFVVGKAVWSRAIIEAAFALWAVLALARPQYRPPRSWLLLLLAAGLGVALLSACFGASVQRSLWSSYERMQGVVDLAHWFALAVVLVSVLRNATEWRALLALNLGVGTAMAALVVARHFQIELPVYDAMPEPHLPRMSGPLGNPTYLAVYMLSNVAIAFGFAVRSWVPGAAAGAAPEPRADGTGAGGRGRRAAKVRAGRHASRRRGQAPGGDVRRRSEPAAARTAGGGKRPGTAAKARICGGMGGLPWVAVAGLHFWGLVLAGSVAGFVGLLTGAGFLALAYGVFARGRRRWAAVLVVVVLGASAALALERFVDPDWAESKALDSKIVRRVANIHLTAPSVQSRLAAWEAGIEGFAQRPALGWGPDNFGTVFGRFASGYAATQEPHDQAHGKLVEVAATTGALGLAAYVALWSAVFLTVWRAARRMAARERAFVLFAGAALASGWVQSQSLFDTAIGSLQTAVLLGYVISLEAVAFPERRRPWLPARWSGALAVLLGYVIALEAAAFPGRGRPRLPARWSGALAGLPGRKGARVGLAGAAVALALAGLVANHAILAAADVRHLGRGAVPWRVVGDGIDGFRPLGNTYRRHLFNEIARHWPRLRAEDGAAARRLLDWAAREAGEVARTEPGNWRIHHSLARMYRATAATDPEFGAKARYALERARELAPNREVFPRRLLAPESLEVRRRDDGRHVLHWRPSEGAGFHQLSESRDGGIWYHILYAYDPDRNAFVTPGPRGPGSWRYRIEACRYPGQCSAGTESPPLTVSDGEASRNRRDGGGAAGGPGS